MILYYITDRKQFAGDDSEQCSCVLAKIAEAARAGVDYIQLREKDLPSRGLEELAKAAVQAVRGSRTHLLINSRSDVALACGADGVHLTSTDLPAGDARALWMKVRPESPPVIAVSCHSTGEVRMAESQGADFAVLAPIYEKQVAKHAPGVPPLGVQLLAEACGRIRPPEHTESAPTPSKFRVLALGGITLENAETCLAAGAAGIAGIRIFQENDVADVVRRLRQLGPFF